MRSKFIRFLTLFMVFVFQFALAQEKTITGVVSDELGPIAGANVVVKGTANGVATDFDGNFSIKTSVGDILVVTYTGMEAKEVVVGMQNSYNIKMVQSLNNLNEVVVEAYRTTTKTKSNVAVNTVTASTIEARPNASFIQTLQAQVPGLNIQTGTGQPGSASTVIIRGLGSINGNTEPLYVIDGIPQNGASFRSLNPNEIESISVLKDAGATAIYGNRGANGVIVVTTKKGGYNSALSFQYLGTTGFSQIQGHDYNLMNSRQLLTLEKARGVGLGSTLTDAEIADFAVDTNWQDVFFRTGLTQTHTLGMSSGSDKLASFTSFGFTDQQGILIGSDLKRFNFRNNLNGKSGNEKFTYGTNVSINWSRRNEITSLGTGSVNQNFAIGANAGVPYVSPDMYVDGAQVLDAYENDPIYGGPLAGTLAYTPLMLLDKYHNFRNNADELKALAGANGAYKFTKNLSLSSSLGLNYTQNNGVTWQSPEAFNSYLFLQPGQEFDGFETFAVSRSLIANMNTQLKYVKNFGDKHTVEASLFSEYIKAHFRSNSQTQNGLDPKVTSPGSGNGYIGYDNTVNYVPNVSAAISNAGLFSYFAFVDYDYDSKYGFSGSVRRDASYRFNADNRWGTFWSVAARWNIDKESFMDGSVFDVLKLRASYGSAGNQDILGTGLFGAENLTRGLYDSATGYGNANSYGVVQLGNAGLKWETITQANIGLDFELFKSRLRGSVDVYEKKTSDLYQPVGISAINAITTINKNYGTLKNSGIETILAYDVFRPKNEGGYKLTLKFNGSYNKNEIGDLPEADGLNWDGESLTANREGDMLNQFYLLDYAGVNPVNGNLLFRDSNGNLTENPDPATDRVFTGKSALPKYQGGFGFDMDYKGFYLTTMFSYVYDVYRFDYDYEGLVDATSIGQFNMSSDLEDAWTVNNTDTYMPALNASNASLDDFSDRFLKDASYVRLRYASVGYNVPSKMFNKTFLTGAKFFVQGENLVTWTKWRGWDAESNRAADQYRYPTPRTFSLGLELKF